MSRKQTEEVLQKLMWIEQLRMESGQNLIDRMKRMTEKLGSSEPLTQEDLRTIVYLCGAAPGRTYRETCQLVRDCGISRIGVSQGGRIRYRLEPKHITDLLDEPIPDFPLEMYVQSACTIPLVGSEVKEVDETGWELRLMMESDDDSFVYRDAKPLV